MVREPLGFIRVAKIIQHTIKTLVICRDGIHRLSIYLKPRKDLHLMESICKLIAHEMVHALMDVSCKDTLFKADSKSHGAIFKRLARSIFNLSDRDVTCVDIKHFIDID